MRTKRQPGAWGSRSARTFAASSSQYLDATSLGVFAALTVPFTVAGWFNPVPGTGAKTLWSAGTVADNSNYWRIEYDEAAGNLSAETRAASSTVDTNASGVIEGTWNHVAGVYDSTTSRTAYVRGIPGTTSTTLSNPNSPTSMQFGRLTRQTPLHYLDGALGSWGIWSVALSADEIRALSMGAHPTTVRPQALLECWDLDRVGPITGLIRGTILAPVNGGGLTAGPNMQGPPVARRFYFARAGGGAAQNATSTAATASWATPVSTATPGAVAATSTAATSTWNVPASTATAGSVTATSTAALAAWETPTSTATVGSVTATSTATAASWDVPASTATLGLAATSTAATASWFVPISTATVGAVTAVSTAATASWATPVSTATPGAVTTISLAALASWYVPASTAIDAGLLADAIRAGTTTHRRIGAGPITQRRIRAGTITKRGFTS